MRKFWVGHFPRLPQSVGVRYSIALIAFAISFSLREALDPWLATDRGFIFFFPAIILTTFFAGLGPAILTALLSSVAAWYFFLPPYNSFRLNLDGEVGLATFVLGSSVAIALVQLLRITINRVEAERASAEALARQLKALFDADPNGFLVVDPTGRIRMVNGHMEKLFGYHHNELLGQSVEMLVPDRFRRNHASLRDGFTGHPSNRPMGAGRDLYGLRKDGSEFPVEIGLSSFTPGDTNMSLAIVIDITERKRSEEVNQILMREIQHRSQNLLAVIQAVAHMSFSDDDSVAQARKAFEARLQALARANAQLSKSNWSGVNLSEIVRIELEPFVDRTTVEGVGVVLGAQSAQNFSLALHELATNAAKYGALSNGTGKVKVLWTVTSNGKDNRLKFKWQESEGPIVVAPIRNGFGTTLLKAAFEDVRLDYAIEGLSCEIDALLDHGEPSAEPSAPLRHG